MLFSRRQWLASVGTAFSSVIKASGRPPNLVIVLADDLGYGDLGVYGHPTIRTPHLDRMAGEGARLTSFYATPTCTPSRAALLTGRYPIRSGLVRVLYPGEKFGIPDSEITLADMMKQQGYATALIGKWHLGNLPPYRPTRHGFDTYYGLLYSNDMKVRTPNFRRLKLFRNDTAIEWPVNQATLTRRYTQEALAFMDANKRTPFFLYLAHSMPHVPLHASEEFRGRSNSGPYGDAVEEIDWSTGQILAGLKALGLDEETLVIFTSDNGPARRRKLGSAGVFRGGKGTTWEGGVRVPFLARWPGRIPPGIVNDGIGTIMDVFPMSVELAGGRLPADRVIDGRNIFGMLTGAEPSPHEEVYIYRGARICAVRWRNWKLHLRRRTSGPPGLRRTHELTSPELYNLEEDPSESIDLAAGEAELVSHLSALVAGFRAGVKPGKLPPRYPVALR